ncbi:hypothetical protein ACJMK2_026354 [Sinanodonta woodiana]|uniref:ATP-dependent DNA helicase n=1 Tax=Sinanodonta woodiana TaxID=1069815 RepID=A0ABD3XJB9_SINWO
MKTTYEKIKSADRHFENLESICSLNDPLTLFGQMQIIFLGYFVQLPPMRNILYDNDGRYCFESDLFEMVFVHRVFLKDVVRQTQYELINAIAELSGAKTEIGKDTISLMDQLSRPLSDDGMSKKNISLTQRLWLEKKCCVVLILNISDTLENGSQSQVVNCEEDCMPLPLKLVFARTIHKSQVMTLDRLEIDCRQISQPGQLAVAIGRVCTLDAFIQQPEKIHVFCNQSSEFLR